jgi:hypothetical protein
MINYVENYMLSSQQVLPHTRHPSFTFIFSFLNRKNGLEGRLTEDDVVSAALADAVLLVVRARQRSPPEAARTALNRLIFNTWKTFLSSEKISEQL